MCFICSGSFATVKLAESREDKSKWAVKIINKSALSKEDEDALEVEVKVLSELKHPNIVEFRELFDCPKTFYLVMELMEGGELFDRIVEKEKYSEKEAQTVVRDIASALEYCHEKKVVHRDLKVFLLNYDVAWSDMHCLLLTNLNNELLYIYIYACILISRKTYFISPLLRTPASKSQILV